MAKKDIFRRRRFFIDKGFQLRAIRTVLLQTLLTSALLLGVFYYFQMSHLEFISSLSLDQEKTMAMHRWADSTFGKILVVVVLACAIQAVITVFISHRTAGPVHRLKQYLGAVAHGGEAKPVHFRKGDDFKDLQESYNEMVGVLEKERLNDLRLIHQMEDGISHLKKMIKDEQAYQVADYLERLNRDLKNFKTH